MKVDPAATAQALARQLLRRLPHPGSVSTGGSRTPAAPDLERKVLDAAAYRFAQQGVTATTMSQLAKDAGISREWLYRHYENRNAVLAALALREIHVLLHGIAERAAAAGDVVDSVVDAFTYAVSEVRDHPLLQRIVESEPQRLTGTATVHGDAVFEVAVDAVTALLMTIGEVAEARARLLGETLVRLALATVIAPGALRSPDDLAAYIRALTTALLTTSVEPVPR